MANELIFGCQNTYFNLKICWQLVLAMFFYLYLDSFILHFVFMYVNFFTWICQRGFDQQWLSLTFSKAIFLGNGLVAIFSGLFGNVLVDTLALGPVAPFDAAACFLAIGMVVILTTWTENYGDPSENKNLLAQFRGAAVAIASGIFLTIDSILSLFIQWFSTMNLNFRTLYELVIFWSRPRNDISWNELIPRYQICHQTIKRKQGFVRY